MRWLWKLWHVGLLQLSFLDFSFVFQKAVSNSNKTLQSLNLYFYLHIVSKLFFNGSIHIGIRIHTYFNNNFDTKPYLTEINGKYLWGNLWILKRPDNVKSRWHMTVTFTNNTFTLIMQTQMVAMNLLLLSLKHNPYLKVE